MGENVFLLSYILPLGYAWSVFSKPRMKEGERESHLTSSILEEKYVFIFRSFPSFILSLFLPSPVVCEHDQGVTWRTGRTREHSEREREREFRNVETNTKGIHNIFREGYKELLLNNTSFFHPSLFPYSVLRFFAFHTQIHTNNTDQERERERKYYSNLVKLMFQFIPHLFSLYSPSYYSLFLSLSLHRQRDYNPKFGQSQPRITINIFLGVNV